MNKKGVEIVISTLVVVILAITVLIFGLVLTRSTMCKAKQGVNLMSDLSKQEINAMFSDQNNNVAVKEVSNEISKGIYYGVGFVIENDGTVSDSTQFSYTVSVADIGDCSVMQRDLEDYIVSGSTGTAIIQQGNTYSDVVEFMIPRDAQLCTLKYRIDVKKNGQAYGSAVFNVIIKPSSWISSTIC